MIHSGVGVLLPCLVRLPEEVVMLAPVLVGVPLSMLLMPQGPLAPLVPLEPHELLGPQVPLGLLVPPELLVLLVVVASPLVHPPFFVSRSPARVSDVRFHSPGH